MKKKLKLFISFLILFLTSSYIFLSQATTANPLYIPEVTFSGGLIPKDNCSLALLSANVKIDVDTSNLRFRGKIHFNGNYTIFNPESDINITIGAPFEFRRLDNCTVLLNGTKVPFITIAGNKLEQEYNSEIWEEYLVNELPYYHELAYFRESWVLCNISIPKNSSIKLEYDFIVPRAKFTQLIRYYYILYDVGTARLWNGNTTEIVEINVNDNLPTSIFSEDLCDVSNISNRMSYRWEWNNERIEINFLGLYYYLSFLHEYDYLYTSIKLYILLIISIVGILLFIKKYNSSIKIKKRNKQITK